MSSYMNSKMIQWFVPILVIFLSIMSTVTIGADRKAYKKKDKIVKLATVILEIKADMIVTEKGLFEIVESTQFYDIKENPVYLNKLTLPAKVELVYRKNKKLIKTPQALKVILQEEFRPKVKPN